MRHATTSLIAAAALLLGMSAQAQAQTVRLTAVLSGANETPAPGVLTGAAGTVEVFVNMHTKDVVYEVKVFNMPSGTTAGHFHVGGPGLAGPIVVDLSPPPNISNDYTLAGTASASSLRPRPEFGVRDWDDFIQSLVGGQTYVNIHSTAFPAGEIRGQVTIAP